MHIHTDLLNNSPLLQAFTWAANKRQRGSFLLEQTALSWFAKPLDFGDPPSPSPITELISPLLSSAHIYIRSPDQAPSC